MSDDISVFDFRRLFETLPGSYVVIRPDLTVVAVSDEYLRTTMVNRADLVGRNVFEVFPENPKDTDSHGTINIRGSIERVFETGEANVLPVQRYDIQRPAALGGGYEERYWRISTAPGFDAAGNVAYAAHRVEDITEQFKLEQNDVARERINAELEARAKRGERKRKQAEAALEDARMRLEAALAAGEIGTWTWNVPENKVVADKNLAAFFAVSETDAQGGKIEQYIAAIHPDDRSAVRRKIADALENKDSYEAEYRLINADGAVRWVVARGKIVRDENNQPLYLPGVLIDITERRAIEENLRRSQERLKLVLDSSKLGLWYCDLPFDVLVWSDLTKTHFWLPPEAVVTIEDFYRIIHPDDREQTRAAIDASIADQTQYDVEYRTVDAETDRVKWIRAIGRGFYDQDGNPYRFDGITIDISDEKHIASEREHLLWSEKEARAEAENANRLKDDFLATLSHELRTPLSSILGWSRMLREGHLEGEQARRAVETIERNARSQAQLVEDILDVSRIVSGKLRISVEPVDLVSIIETALEAARPAMDAKNIRLQRVLDSDVMISGDADRLQQIVWNLLSNAIKFTPKNGRVQIKLERVNSHVEITVADDGIGINAETLPFVFDRFRQSDSSTTRRHGGLGLGLAIVRHLVELHGGTVHAMSEGADKGSVFTVTFPIIPLRSKTIRRDQETQSEPAQNNTRAKINFECPAEIKGLRILIVDDEPDTREMLGFIFEKCAAKIKSAASVAEALDALENEQFDVLVSDIGMPERDGFDLIKTFRQRGGQTPAVALTAYARVEDRMKVLSAGFQMHVPKPVEPAELLAVVASLANRSRQSTNSRNQ